MKNMKKRVMAAFLTAVMVIATFAPASAATLNAKQYLNKMTKAANKATSYEVTTNVVQNATMEGQAVDTKAVSKQTVFTRPINGLKINTINTPTRKIPTNG